MVPPPKTNDAAGIIIEGCARIMMPFCSCRRGWVTTLWPPVGDFPGSHNFQTPQGGTSRFRDMGKLPDSIITGRSLFPTRCRCRLLQERAPGGCSHDGGGRGQEDTPYIHDPSTDVTVHTNRSTAILMMNGTQWIVHATQNSKYSYQSYGSFLPPSRWNWRILWWRVTLSSSCQYLIRFLNDLRTPYHLLGGSLKGSQTEDPSTSNIVLSNISGGETTREFTFPFALGEISEEV